MARRTRSLTFLYPTRGLGGAQLLFLRLARELARRGGLAVQVIDFPDGFLARRLATDPEVALLPCDGAPVQLPEGTTLVAPLSSVAELGWFVRPPAGEFGLLLWSIHPDNVTHLLDGMGRRWVWGRGAARRVIRELAGRGSVVYMDAANAAAVARAAGPLPAARYLPIPHGYDGAPPPPRPHDPGRVQVAWLGRISYDKIFSIRKIVDEIADSPRRDAITLHVIGDGDRAGELAAHLAASGIDHRLAGVLVDDALTDYIARHVDLGIAMGTSCLEFAARGVPALLIDYSLAPFPRAVRYNWLFESESYILGESVEAAGPRRHTFAQVLDQLRDDPTLGARSREYATRRHGIAAIADELLACAAAARPLDAPTLGALVAGVARGPYRHLLAAARRALRAARRVAP